MRLGKYKAKPCVIDNIRFASQAEGRRYRELKLLERAGLIKDLVTQVKFPLIVNNIKVCTYISDFNYLEGGKLIVEDTKGFRTPAYIIKKKLMRALYSIEIRETK